MITKNAASSVTTSAQPQSGSRDLPRVTMAGASSVKPMPSPYAK